MSFVVQNGWTKVRILDHIRTNFKGKAHEGARCFYRLGEKRCAAGLFIPDEIYQPEFEHKSIKILMRAKPQVMHILPLNEEGMQGLQSAHDNSDGPQYEEDSIVLARMIKFVEDHVVDHLSESV